MAGIASREHLNICLLSYRSNPHSGGQGVYLKNLSRALKDQGHRVTVVCGPPDADIGPDINLVRLPSLDLYDPADPFRMPTLKELSHPINLIEWVGVSTMGFPEPFTFGLRAWLYLKKCIGHFDIVHDNQSLSYGINVIANRIPTIATIHHPITVDRRIAIRSEQKTWRKLKQWRWFSFIGMQRRVARSLSGFITVSKAARRDISGDFAIKKNRFHIVPNGIDTGRFHPVPDIDREPGRLIVTNSADIPLKGLQYLLEAIARIKKRHGVRLTVIGAPKKNSPIPLLIRELGIGDLVTFTGRIGHEEFVRQYARAAIAVVPSVYEGFGLPAGEAMACAVPVISTSGGALPEVVGDAGLLIPPASVDALTGAILQLLENPDRARRLGDAGYRRVMNEFTWSRAAHKTIKAYRKVIRGYR